MRIQRRGGALLILALGLVACGGPKSTASPTSPSDTAVFSTTNPPLPTTIAVATTASPTTAASSTPAPPATAAPTTARPFIPIKDQVAEAVVNHGRLQVACFAAPTTCDVAAITASEGSLRANLTRGVQGMVDLNYVAREDPKDPYSVNVTEVLVADDDRSAVASACLWDPVPVFQVGGAPDGTDILINSVKNTERRTFTVYLEAGEWRIGATEKLGTVKGKNECA